MVIAQSLAGFCSYPILFVGYELVVGLTPGIGEALSCGLTNSFGNGLGFFFVVGCTAFLKSQTEEDSMVVMCIITAVILTSLVLLLITKVPNQDQKLAEALKSDR
jgi:hypothetical protein